MLVKRTAGIPETPLSKEYAGDELLRVLGDTLLLPSGERDLLRLFVGEK